MGLLDALQSPDYWSAVKDRALGLLSPIAEAQAYSKKMGNKLAGLLVDPASIASLGRTPIDAMTGSDWTPSSALNKQQEMAMMAASYAPFGIVSPAMAKTLNTVKNIPEDDLFRAAVANTRGAAIADDGLRMSLQRNQLPEQAMAPSVRGGVFYLPEGAAQAKYYSTGKNGYGGKDKIVGETLIQNPLFAKGGTGGKAPEAAYDSLLGKGSYQAMRNDALDVNWGRRTGGGTDIEEFLAKYAPELEGQGQYILQNSKQGNQLAYALQEAAVASAARKAGHDAVVGYSKGKSGPFLSEVFDVREMLYPNKHGASGVWPDLVRE